MKIIITLFSLWFFVISTVYSKDKLELQTTFIKGNKELPQILYVVPWKDMKKTQKKERQIVLYSLFGDLFEPANPDELSQEITTR